FMKGHKGLMVLEINWPCAGILSMLVYMLVVVILMVKMDAPLRRKVMYAAVGAIGTFLINILRIFSITLAVAYSNVDLRVFHETIGEVLFIIWIMIYLVTTVSVESSLSKKGLKRTPHLDIR
ncbi:MAG: exosortase/archaeosortase family protein, partial [Candidatus Bathyarchaeia archaeon]